MRLYAFVAAAALLSASLAARADTITQSFAVPFVHYNTSNGYSTYGASFPSNPFNPALGTLNSVSLFATGSVTVGGPSYQGSDINFEGQTGNLVFQQTAQYGRAGTYNVSYGATAIDPFTLQSVENPAPYTEVDFNGQGIVSADVTGTVTYDYTPVAATPEPSSLALLGTGLLSVVGVARRRFA